MQWRFNKDCCVNEVTLSCLCNIILPFQYLAHVLADVDKNDIGVTCSYFNGNASCVISASTGFYWRTATWMKEPWASGVLWYTTALARAVSQTSVALIRSWLARGTTASILLSELRVEYWREWQHRLPRFIRHSPVVVVFQWPWLDNTILLFLVNFLKSEFKRFEFTTACSESGVTYDGY